ncbi:class I SAM-dependent methyltransferase [Dyadobacter sp. CY312]|uniref:class I SAM-dependent methyltransferase n=1 Tax=Dyadobacter sp. CY312 TaxID=2907303 RepID=UPI001F3C2D84|nr:class I SAM-dependent methyltransferase [Dyadobacter sp. CY312]MCE7044124.1 class I SAM-dependent methyltransferase [Dyadobacter sp. CY312]
MKNNYDPIASNYDWLSRVIFRRNLVLSQTCLLQHIPANSSILIVGGGTGWILEEISKVHPSGLHITYVEISEKMIQLARKRDAAQNEVRFVNQPIEEFSTNSFFNIVFTAFLFDNFGDQRAELVFKKLDGMLTENGKWLFVDFNINEKKSKWWQRGLLTSMLFFFRVVCNIEARKVIPMKSFFEGNHFQEMYAYERMYSFIKSSVYVRLSQI